MPNVNMMFGTVIPPLSHEDTGVRYRCRSIVASHTIQWSLSYEATAASQPNDFWVVYLKELVFGSVCRTSWTTGERKTHVQLRLFYQQKYRLYI